MIEWSCEYLSVPAICLQFPFECMIAMTDEGLKRGTLIHIVIKNICIIGAGGNGLVDTSDTSF